MTEATLLDTRQILSSVARTRFEEYEYVMCDQFPDPQTFNERVSLGSFSYTAHKTRRRFLLRQSSFDHLAAGVPQTAPEIARDYLDLRYPKKLRASGEQANALRSERSAPLYYRPFSSKCAHYVDLKGAFWWLQSILGWDVDYHPAKFLAPGRAPYDFPLPEHKLARNCLVTAGLSCPLSIWTGHKFVEQNTHNLHLNYGLWSAIMDVLHMFAREAVRIGAHYVSTDGVIIADRLLPEYLGFLSGFHAPYTIKESGAALVTGLGSYLVGTKRTVHFRHEFDRPYSNLRPATNPPMLKDTFYQIARDRLDRPGLFMV